MAALSALLAVGMISSVRRYSPTPDTPKHMDRHTPSDPPVIPATQGKSQHRSPVTHANVVAATAAAPLTATTFAAPKPKVLKPRLRRDDDYVAQDTYIYYGNKGKPVP